MATEITAEAGSRRLVVTLGPDTAGRVDGIDAIATLEGRLRVIPDVETPLGDPIAGS